MARSYKLPIEKDKGYNKREYRRRIRRVQKFYFRQGKDIPHFRSIVNDYDYMDWSSDHRMKNFRPYGGNFTDFIWKKDLKEHHVIMDNHVYWGGRSTCVVYDSEREHAKQMVIKYSRK